jgi:2-hydroxy-3-keto-5-methylthiopentenyl-1-phosphate phosphatase
MAKNPTKVAFIYDFDETLSTTYMQDYILIPALGDKPDHFWAKANQWSRDHCAEQITGSMYYIQHIAKERGIPLTKSFLCDAAKSITYFQGVEEWFDRINAYGQTLGLQIEHYIISSGMEEIIDGTSIRKHFKDIFGCSYVYDDNGVPIWPARVVNYSTKTQFIAKINKGLGKNEDRAVNEYMPDEERAIPYKRMIYFGDGMTDIPSMKITKEKGGNAIAVYRPKSAHRKNAIKLLTDNRVNFALPADYREDSELDHVVKTILDKMATERDLDILKVKEDRKKKLALASLTLSKRLKSFAKKLTPKTKPKAGRKTTDSKTPRATRKKTAQ